MVTEKTCSKCRTVKPIERFCKDRYKSKGHASACKDCRAIYEKQRSFNKQLQRIRDMVRNKSKAAFPGPHKCAVISCSIKAQLHHFDYDKPLEVIPLCSTHHGAVHHIDLIYKKLTEENINV